MEAFINGKNGHVNMFVDLIDKEFCGVKLFETETFQQSQISFSIKRE